MGLKEKVGALLSVAVIVVIVAWMAWRQYHGPPFLRVEVPPARQPSHPKADEAELLVTKDGGYVLDNKPVAGGALKDAVANLRSVKEGVVIDVVAAPGAPSASVAAAIAATQTPSRLHDKRPRQATERASPGD